MKLLILHVSEHRDDQLVRSIWDRIFEDGMHNAVQMCTSDPLVFSLGEGRGLPNQCRPHHREHRTSW